MLGFYYFEWVLPTLADCEDLKFFVVPDKKYSNGDIPRYPLVLLTLNTEFLENTENRLRLFFELLLFPNIIC